MPNLCGACRRCCKGTYIKLNSKEIARWRTEQRYDIILCIESWSVFGNYFIHKKDLDECIFLDEKNGCEIYDTRPEICRNFPKTVLHAKDFNCHIDPETKKLSTNS